MSSHAPVNHVFVDFENVQKLDFDGFGERVLKLTLLIGEKQKRLDSTLVEQLLRHGANVQFVRLTSSGKNALDFALTYYLGRAVASEPTGYFHLVSKDRGFDPLIEHLRAQHMKVARHEDFASVMAQIAKPATKELQPARPPAARTAPGSAVRPIAAPAVVETAGPSASPDEIWAHLKRHRANQPRRRDTLHAVLKTRFRLSDAQADQVISDLQSMERVTVDPKGKVVYHV